VNVSNTDEHFQLFFQLLKTSDFINFAWNDDFQFHLACRAASFRNAREDWSLAATLVVVYLFVVMIVVMPVGTAGTVDVFFVLVFVLVIVRTARAVDMLLMLVFVLMIVRTTGTVDMLFVLVFVLVIVRTTGTVDMLFLLVLVFVLMVV
jgi:hypothetical protein